MANADNLSGSESDIFNLKQENNLEKKFKALQQTFLKERENTSHSCCYCENLK